MPNKPFPGIPSVSDDRNLAPTVRALVEAVEILIGVRKNGKYRAILQADVSPDGSLKPGN